MAGRRLQHLARWLLRDEAAAEDVVQEASLRAWRYFASVREAEARAWFLAIVRNACFSWLEARRARPELGGFDDEALDALQGAPGFEPDVAIDRQREREHIDAAIRQLPPPLREVIVLRELEGLAYAEIAHIASIPIGTVMSRLSRARERLKASLTRAGMDDRGSS